ncbi:UNVERIFIED_CONTAM: hypothetical protein K2H54_022339 [Gekko kuhli]
MSLSAFEVAMQTMGSLFSAYVDYKNGAPVFTEDGLNQMVKEEFPHFSEDRSLSEGEEIPLQEPPLIYINPENQCNLSVPAEGPSVLYS